MTDCIVERLRRKVFHGPTMEAVHTKTIEWQAADRIEALMEVFQETTNKWHDALDRIEYLEKQNGKLKEMFRVHMLRLMPNLTHEDIDNHIEEVMKDE